MQSMKHVDMLELALEVSRPPEAAKMHKLFGFYAVMQQCLPWK